MPDKVLPQVIENSTYGTEVDFSPKQLDPAEDYIACKGIAFENSDSLLIYSNSGDITFSDTTNGTIALSSIVSGNTVVYTTVASAESANGSDNNICYVVETDTFYRYEADGSAYTDDNTYVLSTGDAGTTRWLGIAGKYKVKYKNTLFNTYDGYGSLDSISTGNYNTSYGYNALTNVTDGTINVGVGYQCGALITSGNRNIAIGSNTLYSNQTTNDTIAIGVEAGYAHTSGNSSIYLGRSSGIATTTNTGGVFVGAESGYYNISGVGLLYMGYRSGYYATSSYNTIVGYEAYYGISTQTIGNYNTCVGYQSGYSHTYGHRNTFVGHTSGYTTSSGEWNTFMGMASGRYNAGGLKNTYIGGASGFYFTSANYNTAVGMEAMYGSLDESVGHYNTALGYQSLYSATSAHSNTTLGYLSGNSLTTGNLNVIIGYNADSFSNDDTNSVIIGASVTGTADSQIRIGNSNVTSTYIEGIYSSTNDSNPYVRIDSNGRLYRDSSSAGQTGIAVEDIFTATASQTQFTLSEEPVSEQAIILFIDSAFQASDTFSYSGTTLTLDTAMTGGEKVVVKYNYIADGRALPENFITGLGISNDAGDTANDILISTGRCRDSSNAYNLILSTAITKQIDASWAVGDDAGGLDTGTVANNTWYYIWLIRKDSDGSIDALFSLSATSPTMPSGYTYKRRIRGAVLTNGSANILGFQQYRDTFIFNSPISDLSTTTPATSKTNLTVSVPSILCKGIFNLYARDSTAAYINIYGYNQDDRTPAIDNADFLSEGGNQTTNEFTRIVNNSTISYESNNGTMDGFTLRTLGFIDNAQD